MPPQELADRTVALGFLGQLPDQPRPRFTSGFVGSPIAADKATGMDDDAWLKALALVEDNDFHLVGDQLVGGLHQLAQQLGGLARDNPLRFAKFARKLGPETDPSYPACVANVLFGLSQTTATFDQSLVSEVVTTLREVWAWPGRPVQQVCFVISQLSGAELEEDILNMAAWSATEAEDPTSETWKETGGEITGAGLNCVRGQGVLTIGQLLRGSQGRARVPLLLPVLERAAADPVEQVRVMVPRALLPVSVTDGPKVTQLLRDWLVRATDDCLKADSLSRLAYILGEHEPVVAREVAFRMARSGHSSVRQAGGDLAAYLVLRAQRSGPVVAEDSELLMEVLSDPASRAGVAAALAQNVSTIPNDLSTADQRPVGQCLLVRLLDDESPEVRSAAGRFAHQLDGQLTRYEALFAAVAHLHHFGDVAQMLFYELASKAGELQGSGVSLCERWLDCDPIDATGASDLVLKIVFAVHASAPTNSALRFRCLDVIDRLVEFGFSDVTRDLDATE